MPCLTVPESLSWASQPCPDCGHTALVHPGPSNPALFGCALCQVEDRLAQLRANVQLVADAVDVPVELLPDVAQLADEAARLQLAQAPEYDQVAP